MYGVWWFEMGIEGIQRSLPDLVRRSACDSSVMTIDRSSYPLFVT